jgi:gephyrin
VPDGADAVVMVEHLHVDAAAGVITLIDAIASAPAPGTDVRRVGADAAAGAVALPAGTRIGPHELGLVFAAGAASATVGRRVRVGVLSTGDELVSDPAAALAAGQVRDSNRPMLLAAAAMLVGASDAIDLGHATDSAAAVEATILAARDTHGCDIVITSGGVSMGRRDFVKPVLSKIGTVRFGRVRIKPGKPLMFATVPARSGDERSVGGAGVLFFFLLVFLLFSKKKKKKKM